VLLYCVHVELSVMSSFAAAPSDDHSLWLGSPLMLLVRLVKETLSEAMSDIAMTNLSNEAAHHGKYRD
jgi:hypothetical protein